MEPTNSPAFDHLEDERHCPGTTLRKVQRVQLRMLKVLDQVCSQHDLRYWLDGGTLLGAVRHQGFIPWDDDIDIVMPRYDYDRFIGIAHAVLPADIELDSRTVTRKLGSYNIPCRLRDKHSRIEDTHSADNLGQGLFIDIIPSDVYHDTGISRCLEIAYKRIYSGMTKIYDLLRNFRQREAFPGAAPLSYPLILFAMSGVRFLTLLSRTFLMYSRFQRADNGSPGYGYDVRWTRIFERHDVFPLQRIRFEDGNFLAPRNADGVLRVFYGPHYMVAPAPEWRVTKHLRSVVLDTRLSEKAISVEWSNQESQDFTPP